ncbi:MAG: glucosaminidase domain-containing protein [Colwellia sp.]|nr:glucosaminidase domain-containing protein [Colwellia sp.]MCW8864868.1 glucosaminidase domain-containing protein [Colwellia sp.]MCW9079880.1 glucosaminidase domain-containing protein [Colwellia sp.]
MKSMLLIKGLLLTVLVVCLVAPFTFMSPKFVTVDSPASIAAVKTQKAPTVIKKPVEKPLHQVALPDFAAIKDVKVKKQQFFDFIRPSVERENNKLLAKRAKLEAWLEKVSLGLPLSDDELTTLADLVKRYRVNERASVLQQVNDLLVRIDIVPVSLVLVQAANESAWGTSRFARIGLNFFGIWCYRPGCGMVPGGRDSGAKHEVEAFKSVDAAVARYFSNINTHNAYRVFRTIRFELRSQNQPLNAEILATGLLPYSERGADYVIDITKMLRQNQRYLQHESESKVVAIGD